MSWVAPIQVDKIIEDQRSTRFEEMGDPAGVYLLEPHAPSRICWTAVSSVPPGSIILTLSFTQDVTGKGYTTPEVVERLSQVSTAPIFGVLDTALGHGIVGGCLYQLRAYWHKGRPTGSEYS